MTTIRCSIGTAIQLGIREGLLPDPPTTTYLMVGDKCTNNCAFCTQAREADSRGDLLSRVTWPEVDHDVLIESLKGASVKGFGRVCIQTLNDMGSLPLLPDLIGEIKESSGLPISVSIGPVTSDLLVKIRDSGAERVGIALDGATPRIFSKIKGKEVGNPYTWDGHVSALKKAVEIFGEGKVSTHLIIGMGERDREVVDFLSMCRDMKVLASLFSYTPMKGTRPIGFPPPLGRYRALQLIRYSIMIDREDPDLEYDGNGKLISVGDLDEDLYEKGERIFMTAGCPMCNRPYYNERPGGDLYNYPRGLIPDEISEAFEELKRYVGS